MKALLNSDPPVVTVLEIHDPTAIGETMEWLDQEVVQLDSEALRFRRVIVRLQAAQVMFQSTNRPGRSHTRLKDGCVAVVAFGPRAIGTLNGLAVGPDRLLASPSGVDVEFVVAAGYESVTFFLSEAQHAWFSLAGVQLLQTRDGAARQLYGWGRRLADQAARNPDLFEMPLARSVVEEELLDTLRTVLQSTDLHETTAQDRTRQEHSRVVQIAQAYAVTHLGERVPVVDMGEAAGVSERTLQYAFKEMLGMSPVAYLNRLRLHRVRLALRAASWESTTVTQEALRWGFWHVGDFSQAYKKCFGESPSETLRRQP